MLYFFPMKGFLGTGATFGADLDLVVQLIMGIALIARGLSRETKTVQSSRNLPNDRASFELLNLLMIGACDVAVVRGTSEASAV